MYSSWSLWEVGLSSLQTFSWGIISCSVFKLQGRNCKQFKGTDTIFSFHFFLYIYPEDNQFISSLWKKKKNFLLPLNRSMKLHKMMFTKIPWDKWPLLYFLREDFKIQWPKLPYNGSQKFGAAFVTWTRAPESPETNWALAITGVSLATSQTVSIAFHQAQASGEGIPGKALDMFFAWGDARGIQWVREERKGRKSECF